MVKLQFLSLGGNVKNYPFQKFKLIYSANTYLFLLYQLEKKSSQKHDENINNFFTILVAAIG